MKEFCVDLEIAKELKENGFLQDSQFYFMRQDDGNIDAKNGGLQNRKPWALSIIMPKKDKKDFLENFGHKDKWMGIQPEHFLSAPFSEEILKELPYEINGYILEIIRYENETIEVDYARNLWRDADTEYLIRSTELFYKLSNALAKMWLHLKKEGYIK